jgi:hypothetical protein
MGLCIEVGALRNLYNDEPEGVESFHANIEMINAALNAAGLPAHVEPEAQDLPEMKSRCTTLGYPYDFLHHLRRVVARCLDNPSWQATPLPEGEEAADDPLLRREMKAMRSHVICHSDAEGYYVPVDFEEILFLDDEDASGAGIVGSSQRVLKELVAVAPALGIALSDGRLSDAEAQRIDAETDGAPLFAERLVWLSFYEKARLSVEHRTAICFC